MSCDLKPYGNLYDLRLELKAAAIANLEDPCPDRLEAAIRACEKGWQMWRIARYMYPRMYGGLTPKDHGWWEYEPGRRSAPPEGRPASAFGLGSGPLGRRSTPKQIKQTNLKVFV